ncbi:hypothetical protein [Aureibacillus halotolerans]|uniref:Uncharacterized protein n=1 Tax=Aureibacillus halotolerans TaxID=1508390 RepID=A0A4R6TXZ9_9BACI|nr:hypothetical protein [Aureibacillus halotolerans]TDQ37682.1 hypothetical protein EV213_11242 [Aureibacillus halotolerans]
MTKLSQWEAFMVETLRAKGLQDDVLLDALANGDTRPLEAVSDAFDFSDLVDAFKEDRERITASIREEYQVKFLTKPGVTRLLKLRFGLRLGESYEETEAGVINVPLSTEQVESFQTLLSSNWTLRLSSDGHYDIVQISLV